MEREIISKKLESRRAKDRARYANMRLEQRQAIRDRQNARNATTNQIEKGVRVRGHVMQI